MKQTFIEKIIELKQNKYKHETKCTQYTHCWLAVAQSALRSLSYTYQHKHISTVQYLLSLKGHGKKTICTFFVFFSSTFFF